MPGQGVRTWALQRDSGIIAREMITRMDGRIGILEGEGQASWMEQLCILFCFVIKNNCVNFVSTKIVLDICCW